MRSTFSYEIFPISDSALTIDFGNVINEEVNDHVIGLFDYISTHPPEGMIEAVPAYASLSVYFDVMVLRKKFFPRTDIYLGMRAMLDELLQQEFSFERNAGRLIRLPVCYDEEYGIDLQWIAGQKNVSSDDVIRLHTTKRYRVYMLGFLPGFAYMGETDEGLAVARKREPQPIAAGSVGVAGRQTGVYPLASPGGWQIVGRTPSRLFDPSREPLCLLRAGDHVEFFPITKDEFKSY